MRGWGESRTRLDALSPLASRRRHPLAGEAARELFGEPAVARNRQLFAVLDGARDPDVHRLVATSGLPSTCLFRGPIDQALEENAPWLVLLDRSSEAARELVLEAWGGSWGIFGEAIAELPVLGRHLRGFLRVLGPHGRRLLFRYYDPRVWRVFLPTVTGEEARRLAGPVLRFLTENEQGDALLEDVPTAAGMARRIVPFEPEADVETEAVG